MRTLLVALGAVIVAALLFAMGWQSGADHATATQAAQEALIRSTAAEVEARTAKRISAIRVTNQTIQGQLREVVRESTVYRDCLLDEPARRLLDAARAGTALQQPGDRSVPAAGSSAAP